MYKIYFYSHTHTNLFNIRLEWECYMLAPLASNHLYIHYITNPPRNVCNKSALQTKKHFSTPQSPPFTAVACKCHRGESNTPPRWRHSVTAVTGTFARLVRRKSVVTKH